MSDIIEEKVKQLYINQLTKEEFFELSSESSEYIEIKPNKVYVKDYQIYLIPDDEEELKELIERIETIEGDLYGSEGFIQQVTDILETIDNEVDYLYDNAVLSHESSEELDPTYDGFIIYCGTSTEVMGHENEDWV